MEPTIYKPSVYNGAGIYKNGASGGGGGGGSDFEQVFLTYFKNTSGLIDTPDIGNPYTLSGGTIIGADSSGIYVDGANQPAWNVSSGWHGINLNQYIQNKKKAKLSLYVRIPSFGMYAPMKAGLDFSIYFRYPGGFDSRLCLERYNNTNPVTTYLKNSISGDIIQITDFSATNEPFFKTCYEVDFENKIVKFFYKGLLVAETKYTSSGLGVFLNPVSGGNISITGISLQVK